MTDKATLRIDALMNRRQILLQKIETAARAVVPVLLDADRKNSAAELQQLFFEIDALQQEVHAFVAEDPRSALDALIRKLEK